MGNSKSAFQLSGTIPENHQQYYDSTKTTRVITDTILQYIIKEITVNDLITLSDTEKCKTYVMAKANLLNRYFDEIRVVPSVDKSGTISFKSVKELTKPEVEKQSMCLIVAYYYTRIFQIYGALALTLMDNIDIFAKSGLGYMVTSQGPPGFRNVTMTGSAMRGGNKTKQQILDRFKVLDTYVDEINSIFQCKYISDNASNAAKIYFKPGTLKNHDDEKQTGEFILDFADIKENIYIDVYALIKKITEIKIKIVGMRYKINGSYVSNEIPVDIVGNLTITPSPEQNRIQLNGAVIDPTQFFNNLFHTIIPYIKKKYTDVVPISSGKIKSVPELDITSTMDGLTRTKTYGHCIARALQLLHSNPFDMGGNIKICDPNFLDISKTRTSGLPKPGKSIKTPGLKSLSQLFFDTVKDTSIIISGVENGVSTFDKYMNFMKDMEQLYAGNTTHMDSSVGKLDDLEHINNIKDVHICNILKNIPSTANKDLVTKTINTAVKELFRIQYEHANDCGLIFAMLFSYTTDASGVHIRLHDNINKNGIHEINRINNIARDVLVRYYKNCEYKYIDGIKNIQRGLV